MYQDKGMEMSEYRLKKEINPHFKITNNTYIIQKLFLLSFIVVALVIIAVAIISLIYTPPLPDASILLPWFQGWVHQQPFENAIFILSVASVFAFIFAYILGRDIGAPHPKFTKTLHILITLLFIASIIYMPLFHVTTDTYTQNFYFIDMLLSGVSQLEHYRFTSLFVVWVAVLSILYWAYAIERFNASKISPYGDKLVFPALCLASLIMIAATRIYGISNVLSDSKYAEYITHLDAMIYVFSQVAMDKTVLVDLPSQYGLFPELLNPIFKIVKFNILNFTILMAALQALSFFAVFWVINRVVRNKILALIGGLTIIVFSTENFLFFLGTTDRYFQYWPLRFLWPTVSVFVYYMYLRKKSIPYAVSFSILSAIAILWNLETGIFIFLAYTICMLINIVLEKVPRKNKTSLNTSPPFKPNITVLTLHFITVALVIIIFFLVLRISSGQPLHLSWILEYPSTFYKVGFNMLPLPLVPHPWMAVLGIYLLGLIWSLLCLRKKTTLKNELLLYICILGVGLFTYYQGRAHPYNLDKVLWPSIIVGLMLIDTTLRGIKLKIIPLIYIAAPSIFICIMTLANIVFIFNIPYDFYSMKLMLKKGSEISDPIIQSELNFIRKHMPENKTCLLLTRLQGVYSSELGIVSPIKGPGLIEMLLKKDLENFVGQVDKLRPTCVFLGPSTISDFDYGSILKNYKIIDRNAEKTMTFLQPQ